MWTQQLPQATSNVVQASEQMTFLSMSHQSEFLINVLNAELKSTFKNEQDVCTQLYQVLIKLYQQYMFDMPILYKGTKGTVNSNTKGTKIVFFQFY